MFKSVTIAILSGAYGLFGGLILPAAVAYSILFIRREGRHLKAVLRLSGRLLLGLLGFSILSGSFGGLLILVGGEEAFLEPGLQQIAFLLGGQIGLWGAIVGLVVGFRRARKSRAVESQ